METFLSQLEESCQSKAIDNRVILTFTNHGYIEFVYNWKISVDKIGIHNYIIVAMDEATHIELNEKGIDNVLLFFKDDRVFNETDSNFGTPEFIGICNEKPWLITQVLNLGFDVLWIDADIVVFKDPFEIIDLNPDIDFQFQSDDDDICAGFYYAKSNSRVIRFMQRMLKYLNPLVDDQVGMRRFLQSELAHRVSDKETDYSYIHKDPVSYYYDEKEKIQCSDKISFIVLDRARFPNGTAYFNAKFPQRVGIEPYIVHNNCIIGKTGKKDRFKLFGMWYLKDTSVTNADIPLIEYTDLINAHHEIVTSLLYCNDKLYSASHDKTLRVWENNTLIENRYLNKRGGIWSMQIDRDNNRLYTAGHDRFVKSFDLALGLEAAEFRGHIGYINTVFLHEHKGEKYLFSGSDDGDCRSWNIEDQSRKKIYRGHRSGVSCIKAHQSILFSCSQDGTAIAWEISSGRILQIYDEHKDWVRSLELCFHTEGDYFLATGSSDHTIKIWHPMKGKCILTLIGHTGGVNCLLCSDGVLYSGSDDGTVRVWDVTSGECLGIFETGESTIISCMTIGDSVLYCGTYSHKVYMFPVNFY